MLIEDILMANRVSGMLELLKPANRRWSESLELLGSVAENPPNTGNVSGYMAGPMNAQIPAGQTRAIVAPIFAGIFATHYLLPGRFPLTIELELVNNANQCCARSDPNPTFATPAGPATDLSQNFSMQNVRILCDVVSVDNAVNEELSRTARSPCTSPPTPRPCASCSSRPTLASPGPILSAVLSAASRASLLRS